jgi:hypothetical protein
MRRHKGTNIRGFSLRETCTEKDKGREQGEGEQREEGQRRGSSFALRKSLENVLISDFENTNSMKTKNPGKPK